MTNVMKRAWAIAKEAVAKFGGKVKQYFATSLKQAWAERRIKLQQFAAFNKKDVTEGVMLKRVCTMPRNLVGSEKQIAWAISIRTKFNVEIHNQFSYGCASGKVSVQFFMEFIETARALFIDQTSAKFWIDNRDAKIGQLVAAYRKELMV